MVASAALRQAATGDQTPCSREARRERIRAARSKRYAEDSCEECGNFTLIRNDPWLKCDIDCKDAWMRS